MVSSVAANIKHDNDLPWSYMYIPTPSRWIETQRLHQSTQVYIPLPVFTSQKVKPIHPTIHHYALRTPFLTLPISLSNALNSPPTRASATTGPSTASVKEVCALRSAGGTKMPNMRIGSRTGGFSSGSSSAADGSSCVGWSSLGSSSAAVSGTPSASLRLGSSVVSTWDAVVVGVVLAFLGWGGVLGIVDVVVKWSLHASSSVTTLLPLNSFRWIQKVGCVHLPRCLHALVIAVPAVVHTGSVVEVCLCEREESLALVSGGDEGLLGVVCTADKCFDSCCVSFSYWSRVWRYCSSRVSRRAMSASLSAVEDCAPADTFVDRGVCTSAIVQDQPRLSNQRLMIREWNPMHRTSMQLELPRPPSLIRH